MKTALTAEQSAELIKRGVSEGIVTTRIPKVNGRGFIVEYSPIFTLADLLSLLPKIIRHDSTPFTLDIHANSVGWQTLYFNPDADINIGWACTAELIDSLYETLCFLIDHNHVKLD